MKKLLYLVIPAIVLASCNNRQAEMDQAARQRDSLFAIINERDSSINAFISDFSDIQASLDSVALKQNVITMNIDQQGEIQRSAKERINDNIVAINELMNKNRAKIDQLNRKLKASGSKIAGFEKIIQSLNEQLAQKDAELATLNERLSGLNAQVEQLQTSIDTLNLRSAAQAKTIEDQTIKIHTAYYVVGKTKELQDKKVINRTGGLLGIGRTSKLSPNIDNSKFTKIDFTQTITIPVASKKAKIITYHPADSYTLNKDKDIFTNIQITNPEKFWSASKYLVVVKD